MWRIGESMIGSYTGRMEPPGRPKIVSTPSISRLLMRACPPSRIIVGSLGRAVLRMRRFRMRRFGVDSVRQRFGVRGQGRPDPENAIDLPWGRSRMRTQGKRRRALGEYHESRDGGVHGGQRAMS